MSEDFNCDSLYCLPPDFVNRAFYYNRENQRYESVLDEDFMVDMRKDPFHVSMGQYDMSPKDIKLFEELTGTRTSFYTKFKKPFRKLLFAISTFVVMEHDNEILARYGDPADSFFIVLQGKLDCVINDNQGAAGSATDILTTVKAKKKKQFSSERALNSSKQKRKVVRGQRLLLENGKRMRHRELEINGIVVGTFKVGDSFGETALVGTNFLTRRASVVSGEGTKNCPCVLIRIASKDYERVKKEIERLEKEEMGRFLHRAEFLSHWSRDRIAALVNGAQLCTYPRNSVVEKPGDLVSFWVVKSGTVRRLKRVKIEGESTIMEILNACRGDIIGGAELLHSISYCTGVLLTSKTLPTELIKLSIVAFQMITADVVACQKLKDLVGYNNFLKFFRIKEYHERENGKNHLRRIAVPKPSAVTKEKVDSENWATFCDNIFLSIPSPLSTVEINDRVRENEYYHNALKYLDKKIDVQATSASKEGLRIFAARRKDEKVNQQRREMFQTVAKGNLKDQLRKARRAARSVKTNEIDLNSETSDNGECSDDDFIDESAGGKLECSGMLARPKLHPKSIWSGAPQNSPRNKRLKKNLPFRMLKKGSMH